MQRVTLKSVYYKENFNFRKDLSLLSSEELETSIP